MKQESSYVKQENASSQLCCFRLALCLPCGSFIIPEIARTVHKQTFTDDWGSEKNYRNIVNILALLHDIWRKESVVCIKDLFNAHYGVIKPSVHCVLFKEVPLRDLCVHVQVLRWLICFQMKLYSCKKKKKEKKKGVRFRIHAEFHYYFILYFITSGKLQCQANNSADIKATDRPENGVNARDMRADKKKSAQIISSHVSHSAGLTQSCEPVPGPHLLASALFSCFCNLKKQANVVL